MTRPIRIVFADGSGHVAAGATVIGRKPDLAGHVSLDLPPGDRLASKNHVLVVALDQVVELTDLASTNGTTVTVGGGEWALQPNEPTHATVPCELTCGDSIVRIERS